MPPCGQRKTRKVPNLKFRHHLPFLPLHLNFSTFFCLFVLSSQGLFKQQMFLVLCCKSLNPALAILNKSLPEGRTQN